MFDDLFRYQEGMWLLVTHQVQRVVFWRSVAYGLYYFKLFYFRVYTVCLVFCGVGHIDSTAKARLGVLASGVISG